MTRRRQMAIVALAGMMVALSGASSVVHGQAAPTFSSGHWEGAAQYTGDVNEPTVNAMANADIHFKFLVSGGQVVDGEFTASGEGSGFETGGVTAVMNFSVSATMSGAADRPFYEGTSSFKGTANSGGFEVPLDMSGGIQGQLEPEWATCTEVGGNFGSEVTQAASAFGANVQASGVWVAKRVAAFDDDPNTFIPLDWTKLVDDLTAAANGNPTVDELKALVLRIEEVNAEIVGAAECGVVPAGFEEGLVKDDYFYELLLKIFNKILDNPDAWTVYAHADLLTIAVSVGAVGPSAPDQGSAGVLLNKFQQVLTADLKQLDMLSDVGAAGRALAIYVAAQQAGLDEVAELAKAKLQ